MYHGYWQLPHTHASPPPHSAPPTVVHLAKHPSNKPRSVVIRKETNNSFQKKSLIVLMDEYDNEKKESEK